MVLMHHDLSGCAKVRLRRQRLRNSQRPRNRVAEIKRTLASAEAWLWKGKVMRLNRNFVLIVVCRYGAQPPITTVVAIICPAEAGALAFVTKTAPMEWRYQMEGRYHIKHYVGRQQARPTLEEIFVADPFGGAIRFPLASGPINTPVGI